MPAQDFATMSIAVVDDNTSFLQLMRSILRSFNVGVIFAAENPLRMLDYVRATPVDILLADNVMPEISGLELIRRIRTDATLPQRALSIICVSAYGDRAHFEDAIRAGADDFLVKPVRPAEVYRRLIRQLSDPLPRILVPGYHGPDRRRGLPDIWEGPDRRMPLCA